MRKRDPIPDPETLSTLSLLEWLNSGNGSDRNDAAEELGARRIASTWRPLCRLLKDPYWVVRCSAADSLGMIRAREAIPHLRQALKTLNPVVKGYVARALAELGDADSRPAFERMRRSRNDRIRMEGAAALYVLGDSARLSDVIALLTSSHYRNQCAAATTLADITRREDAARALQDLGKAIKVERNPARLADFRRAVRHLRRI